MINGRTAAKGLQRAAARHKVATKLRENLICVLLALWLPQLQKKRSKIERLAAAATRKKSQKSQEKLRVAAAATRKKRKNY